MNGKSFQDYYPDDLSHCYGCGKLNTHGIQLKSFWDGDETVARYTPQPYHTAIPGYVYGGLLASLVDCHSTGTAAAAAARNENVDIETDPMPRFVTASLHVDYLKPVPISAELEVRGTIDEITLKKVVISSTVSADGLVCAKGKVVAVKMPDTMTPL